MPEIKRHFSRIKRRFVEINRRVIFGKSAFWQWREILFLVFYLYYKGVAYLNVA